jgi:fumarate reductase iron-sulfur subunit
MADRLLTFSIFRYNPITPEIPPRMQEYQLEETMGMSLFIALNRLREELDPSLMFDFVCRAAICGSCAMLINGRPGLACKTLTQDLPDKITVMPLPVFKLVGDLSVDTGVWFRHLNVRTEAWIHTDKVFDPKGIEERMDNPTAQAIYDAERCIECGCCIGACATANMRADFMGAAFLNRIARFMIDPRDERPMAQYFDVVGTDEGVFGCIGLMACDDLCPMEIPLQGQLAFVRRKMAQMALKCARCK